ncbi:CapA family protein [bacterium]|nr:CapA family protein [candidate division CSSED10-310 bacterium]
MVVARTVRILFLACLLFPVSRSRADFMIADFEPPWQPEKVTGYPGEDIEYWKWAFDDGHGASGSTSSLYLYGNTWKLYDISNQDVTITADSVWEVHLYAPGIGTMQGFGITDGTREIRYLLEANPVSGLIPAEDIWITPYTGWLNTGGTFARFKLPVGEDWRDRYGLANPAGITALLFINDEDDAQGSAYFDQIKDITESEPQGPAVDAGPDFSAEPFETVRFSCVVLDPDSSEFDYLWDFGDGSFSSDPEPEHAFSNQGIYNVLCRVTDPTGLVNWDSVRVDVGQGTPVISLLLGGDCMFARRYEDANEDGIPGNGDGSLILPGDGGAGAAGIGRPTRRMLADFRIVNLETPMTDEGYRHPTKSYAFRSRPDSIAGLTENNVHLVSLANNHILDYMERGMEETLEVLSDPTAYSPYARARPIPRVGGGMSRREASYPVTLAVDGLRLGFVGLCSVVGTPANEQPFLHAGYDKPGVLFLNSFNLRRTLDLCMRIADISIVMFHGGIEYSHVPSDYIQLLAREAIELGADMVICHHPHVSQGVEFHLNKPILYSLGNFIFEQKYQHTMMTFMADARVDRSGVRQMSIIPAFVERWVPKFVGGDAGNRLITRILGLSDFLETTVISKTSLNRGIVKFPDMIVTETTTDFDLDFSTTEFSSDLSAWFSPVIVLPDDNHLKRIDAITLPGSKTLMLGRDLFMFGNFEDEDYDDDMMEGTGWDVPGTVSASIHDYNPHQGQYDLRLRRHSSHSTEIEVNSRWRMPVDGSRIYMMSGWYRIVNAVDMRASVRYYGNPWPVEYYDPYTEKTVLGPLSGSTDWTYFETFISAPAASPWAVLHLELSPPYSGDYGYAYFDEIRFVEWEQTLNPTLPLVRDHPGDSRYIALKTGTSQTGQINLDLVEYNLADSDEDGLYDCLEDLNGDGLLQRGESDPGQPDSDGDGLSDLEEYTFGIDRSITNPADPDTDSDGYDDYLEYLEGTDPNDDQSHPAGPTATAVPPTRTPIPPTHTPEPTPTRPPPSETPVMTPTPNPTSIPTVSPTPPPTHTPSTFTPFQTPSPSPGPSGTATSTPSETPSLPTATATAGPPVILDIQTQGAVFRSGEPCHVNLWMENNGETRYADLYLLLEIEGSYWCYPSWISADQGLDYVPVHLPAGYQDVRIIIPEFIMPPAPDSGPYYFYAVTFEPGNLSVDAIVSNISIEEFYLGS